MRFLITLWLLWSLPLAAYAEILTLDKTLEYAFINSPIIFELQKNRLTTFAYEADTTQLLNPEVEWEYDLDNHSSEITVSQPFRLSDLTLSRFNYKKLLEKIDSQEERLDALRLYHQITLAYCEAYLAQEAFKYALLNQTYLEKANKTVIRSFNNNGLSKMEAALLEADTLAITEETQAKKWEKEEIFLSFMQKIGIQNQVLSLKRPPRFTIKTTLADVLKAAQKNPSYQQILALQKKQTEQKLTITKQDSYFPILEPKIIYGYNNEENQDTWRAGLILSIPLWNQNSGQLKALKAEDSLIETRQINLEKIGFENLIEKKYQAACYFSERAEAYFTKILPLYEKSITETEEAFTKGEVSVLVVWQAKEKWATAQTTALIALKEAYEAKADLELLIGSRLEDIQ